MAFLVPNAGEDFCLGKIVNSTDIASQNLFLKLYESNTTPTETSVVGDFTEVTDGTYNAIELTGSSWVILNGLASYAQQTFNISGAQTIYGYYITNYAGTILVLAELFGSAITIGSGGGTVAVTPTINLD